jgi:nickel-type superoxide dismutase maturation protease
VVYFFMLKTANWLDIISLLLKYSQRCRVEGNSMLPTLKHGEEVLVKFGKTFQVGDIVFAKHPYKQSAKMIKRIEKISTSGKLFLIGDNPSESTDSRSFGEISAEEIIGKVVCRLSRKATRDNVFRRLLS